MTNPKKEGSQQHERRKFRRRQIIDSFSMFVAMPKKGGHKLILYDLSEEGIGFAFDTEGEAQVNSPLSKGDPFMVHLYLNQSLFLPLNVRIARIEPGAVRRVGAEFTETSGPAYLALQAFIQFLDKVEILQ